MIETAISVQTLGVGLAAFVATLTAAFLFVNAYHDTVARTLGYAMLAAAIWGWFGFASAAGADHGHMELARQLRICSMFGNVLLAVWFVRFAMVYAGERVPQTRIARTVFDIYALGAVALALFMCSDLLFGTVIMAGPFYPNTVTPLRGPMFDVFVLYYLACLVGMYVMMRQRVALESGPARRGHVILICAMVAGATAGVTGFAAWYGIHSAPLLVIRALAVPLFAVAAFYAMSSHNLFNVRVAAANVFVMSIWTFLFFRILLNPSLSGSTPDIILLGALIVLGTLLIRSFSAELDNRLLVERIERERAIEQSKSEFISIAAHQLRTPLTGVQWVFSALESAKRLTPEEHELVKKGGERTKDAIERIAEMLRAARLNGETFKFTLSAQDIRPVLRDSIAMFEGAASARKLELVASIPRKVLSARIDPEKLGIAVQNLIDNAIKYTNTGSVTVLAQISGDRIEIRVTDTGIGIASDDREHLFEKFYRHEAATKMFTDGSGLGLFIVKKIIDAHGGTITVSSETGAGSTFLISIPAVKNV